KDVDLKTLKVDLHEGDVIVMISDGVTQGREDCPWLYETLQSALDAEGIKGAVELILERARRECADDDISVVAIKVEKNTL
ncbi:MAG: SpoIIE family protein phosphatase, partial [Clostridia bacterium]|nr:SpoIIE family protein phosphatase [Clostridia bacterium]